MLLHYKYLFGNEWVNLSSGSLGTDLAVHRSFPRASSKKKKKTKNTGFSFQDFENLPPEKNSNVKFYVF